MPIFNAHFQIRKKMFEPIAKRQKVLRYSAIVLFRNSIIPHYCLVSLMWMKIGSKAITEQVPGVS
jgi:hypothetical protein